jgi:ribosomal protein S7
MSRRHRAKKRIISPDPSYDSRLVHMLVNRVMKCGSFLMKILPYIT